MNILYSIVYFSIAKSCEKLYNSCGDIMKQFLEIGKLNSTHGIKGELKMMLWCDGIDYLKQFKVLYLDNKGERPLIISWVRAQKNLAVIKFEGIDSIEKAEEIKGRIVYGNRNDVSIDENSNYIADLIGCRIVDIDTEEEYGEVTDVVNYGSCDIYDVKSNKKHTLIPAIPDIVKEIDVDHQLIRIKKMKGLFDEN